MSKLTVGKKQGRTVNVSDHSREGKALVTLGIVVICVMLSLPMMGEKHMDNENFDGAVPVMSSGIEEMEKDIQDTKDTSTAEKWSIYDYIGEMFAELIFGDR